MAVRVCVAVLALGGLITPAWAAPPEDAGKMVTLEVRLVRVCGTFFDTMRENLKLDTSPVLSERELFLFLTAAQNDPCTSVLMAPRVTVLDGGTSCLSCSARIDPGSDKKAKGVWNLSLHPEVSPSGKTVRVCVKGNLSAAAGGEVKVKKTLRIANGSTAVLGVWEVPAVDPAASLPSFVTTLPSLCQIYKQAKREPHHLLLLVTPRVVAEDVAPSR